MIQEERRVLGTINKYWAIIGAALVFGGGAVVGYLHLQWTVNDLKCDADMKESNATTFREKARAEKEAMREDIIRNAKDIEWLKELRRENATRDHSKP